MHTISEEGWPASPGSLASNLTAQSLGEGNKVRVGREGVLYREDWKTEYKFACWLYGSRVRREVVTGTYFIYLGAVLVEWWLPKGMSMS